MIDGLDYAGPAGGDQGRHRGRRTALTRLLAAALVAGSFIVCAAPSALAQGTSTQAIQITAPANAAGDPQVDVEGISCSSFGNCSAVGNYSDRSGNQQAMRATETSGTWARAAEVKSPANAAGNPQADLEGISCSSVGNCTAVGSYADNAGTDGSGNGQAMVTTETAGTWSRAAEIKAPVTAVSAGLAGIWCSSVAACTAVGSYTDSADNQRAMAATEISGAWTRATEVIAPAEAEGASLEGIWCSSVGNCTAVGSYDRSENVEAMAATEVSGTWGRSTEVITPGEAEGAYLYGISCSSAGNCTAVGQYFGNSGPGEQAIAATETSGTWTRATEVKAPANAAGDPQNDLEGVSCSSVGNCTAVGSYIGSSGRQQAMKATETSGTWTRATEVKVPANAASDPQADLEGISCSSVGNCTAVGSYADRSGPQALAVTQGADAAHNFEVSAYVANPNSNNVSVISTSTNTVVKTVRVGTGPGGVAITPNRNDAYVTNYVSNTVSVIKTSTNTVVKTVKVGSNPAAVAITPNGRDAYVVNNGSNSVSVISTSTNTVVKTVRVGSAPGGVAITPNGGDAYVANYFSNDVSVIKASTDTVVKTVKVGSNPASVAITPNGSDAYVVNNGSNNVSIISTCTNKVVKTVGVGRVPAAVAITPNGGDAYVTNSFSNNVSIIKTSTDTVVKTVRVGSYPIAVAITPNGSDAYVADGGSNSVSVIKTSTDSVVKTVKVGSVPAAVAIT